MSTSTGAEREVRIGLVLYGGVSLAIYINGVVQEFLHLVKSTAEGAGCDSGGGVSGTRAVYRKLSRILAGQASEGGGAPVRFVIDAIAGTSAGGINGVFLAKALALNGDLDGIKKLWVEEGDIAKLINDEGSLSDEMKRYELQSPPASLLNSQRMYVKLLQALGGMKAGEGKALAKEIDLHITATDLRGLVQPIQLSDGQVFERRHRAEFHFRYSEIEELGGRALNQFTRDYDPFLAFAARCTSSFPFAFEPMQFADIDDALRREGIVQRDEASSSASARWEALYPSYTREALLGTGVRAQLEFGERPFADGGYLDNKPFSFVIDEILRRQETLPVDRKLFYLEPAPEAPQSDKLELRRPNAVANAWMALSSLPRYETIRGDLERARQRNREIDRLRRLVESVRAAAPGLPAPEMAAGKWQSMTSRDLAESYGPGYTTYHCVKVSSVTDDLTALLCRHFAVDADSLLAMRLRYLLESWRDQKYGRPESGRDTLNQFLLFFDVRFRLRRLHHLFRLLDEASHASSLARSERARRIRTALVAPYDDLLRLQRGSHASVLKPLGDAAALKSMLGMGGADMEMGGLRWDPSSAGEEHERAARLLADEEVAKAIDDAVGGLDEVYRQTFTKVRDKINSALLCSDDEPAGGAALCRELEEASSGFERLDMLTFPILFNTGIGELDEIDLYRVSPADAPLGGNLAGGKGKVKGAALGAFAGFLEREWRVNDILWGRLDGAERIIAAMLPGEAQQVVREALIAEAQTAIVDEELAEHPKLQGSRLQGPALLREWMKLRLEEQQRGPWARTLARSTTVVGDILEAIARRTNAGPTPLSGVAHVGRLAWGLIEISTPRRYSELVFRYWMTVLFAVGALLVVLGVLLPAVQAAGWVIVGLTVAAKLGSGMLQDWFQEAPEARHRPTIVLVGAAAGAVALPVTLFFAALGLAHASGPLPLWTNRFAFWVAAAAVVLTLVRMVQVGRASKGLPLASIERWKTLGDVERDCGEVKDDRRAAVRRHLEADQRFVASYALLFGAMGFAMLRTGGVVEGLVVAVCGMGAAVADYFENERISRNIAASLRELNPVLAAAPVALDLPVAPVSTAKWILFYTLLPFASWWLLRGSASVAAQVAGWSMTASCVSGLISLARRDAQFQTFSLLVLLAPGLPGLAVYLVMRALGA
ncbi:MAG: patatin-like protein [Acidobacteria bacterium]|nr:patatin-like protein [Acidobacteriota bacterium]